MGGCCVAVAAANSSLPVSTDGRMCSNTKVHLLLSKAYSKQQDVSATKLRAALDTLTDGQINQQSGFFPNWTPLEYAVLNTNTSEETLRLVIGQGADPLSGKDFQRSALGHVLRYENEAFLRVLLGSLAPTDWARIVRGVSTARDMGVYGLPKHTCVELGGRAGTVAEGPGVSGTGTMYPDVKVRFDDNGQIMSIPLKELKVVPVLSPKMKPHIVEAASKAGLAKDVIEQLEAIREGIYRQEISKEWGPESIAFFLF